MTIILAKSQGQKSLGSKVKVQTDGQTDGRTDGVDSIGPVSK